MNPIENRQPDGVGSGGEIHNDLRSCRLAPLAAAINGATALGTIGSIDTYAVSVNPMVRL